MSQIISTEMNGYCLMNDAFFYFSAQLSENESAEQLRKSQSQRWAHKR